jgi:glycosyltransferase involved in cell wall biosynthesis
VHVFLNGLAASAGAGLTYLRNVVPQLAATPGLRATIAVQPKLRPEFNLLQNVDIFSPPKLTSTARRFRFEQWQLPEVIKRSGADVLISAGNFAIRNSPVPQILLSGNSLYTSADFYRDLKFRRKYGMLIDTFLKGAFARKSVHWADRTVAPSQAFASDLRHWSRRDIETVHHGFDRATFFQGEAQLPEQIRGKLHGAHASLRLLFVSHYNYYRNFETLLRALPLLQKQLSEKKIKLFLTCRLEPGTNPGAYDPKQAARLVRDLKLTEIVEELGPVPYGCLHHLYRACDIYVSAAYTETFAHPLVEAMASGLPIIASDLEVHREVCADAALYFPRFAYDNLAENIATLTRDQARCERLKQAGFQRVADFSWSRHVQMLLQIADELCLARPMSGQISNLTGNQYLAHTTS